MSKLLIVLVVSVLAVCFCVSAEAAPVVDKTVSVAASGSITGSTSMSIDQTSITFGTTSADAFPTAPTSKKVVIGYTSNYNPWKVMVYTNNTQVTDYNTTTMKGRYAKGGLVAGTGDTAQVVPCKWIAKVGSNTVVPTVPGQTSKFNYIKDKRDQDDPATTGALENESWAAGMADGYPNIAFGDTSGGFCVDPTNDAPADPLNKYKGDAISGSIAVYIDAMFGSSGWPKGIATPAGAGSYAASIYFDLYHE